MDGKARRYRRCGDRERCYGIGWQGGKIDQRTSISWLFHARRAGFRQLGDSARADRHRVQDQWFGRVGGQGFGRFGYGGTGDLGDPGMVGTGLLKRPRYADTGNGVVELVAAEQFPRFTEIG